MVSESLENAVEAVDVLVTLLRSNPDAAVPGGVQVGFKEGGTVRDIATDAASQLDDCNPDLARRLDREL
jgi:hypothetical protein